MAASNYPSKASVPRSLEYELPSEYPVTVSPQFADGGRDFNLDNATARIRRWVVEHVVITETEAALYDAQVATTGYNDGVGSALSFDFTDRDGNTHANVRYDRGGVDRPAHVKKKVQTRRSRLIKYP